MPLVGLDGMVFAQGYFIMGVKSMSDLNKHLLGVASRPAAEHLKAKLSKDGIEIVLLYNASTCKSSCSSQLEMWAHPADVESIQAAMATDWRDSVSALGYDPNLADMVFDQSAAHATCPACGTVFSTDNTACSDCGLEFSVPNLDPSVCGPGKKCK